MCDLAWASLYYDGCMRTPSSPATKLCSILFHNPCLSNALCGYITRYFALNSCKARAFSFIKRQTLGYN